MLGQRQQQPQQRASHATRSIQESRQRRTPYGRAEIKHRVSSRAASLGVHNNNANSSHDLLEIKDSGILKKYMEFKLGSTSTFKKLKILEVRHCDQELTKFLSFLPQYSPALQRLIVKQCELLEQVFDLQCLLPPNEQPHIISIPNLKMMRLCDLPKLTFISNYDDPLLSIGTVEFGSSFKLEIIDCRAFKGPGKTMSFKMLKHLKLSGCCSVIYVFPLYVVHTLEKLEKIVITDCEMLERVFGDEEEIKMRQSNSIHELPQVNNLILEKLPKFNGLCHEGCMVEWRTLKKLRVVECPKIQKSSLGLMKRNLLQSVKVKEYNNGYLFEILDEISIVEELKIKGSEHLKKYMEMEPEPSSFGSLKTLEATQCDEGLNKLLRTLFHGSHDLENLTIENCEVMEQLFDHGDLAPNIPKLRRMRLNGLPKLNCIWNIDPKLRGTIEISDQVELEITNCGILNCPLPTALLEKLVQLKIESCDMMEQVMDEEKEVQHRLLHNLKTLQLVKLQKLKRFNSGNYILTFPNLKTLVIQECPTLNAFYHAPPDEQMALLVIPAELPYGKVPLQNLETMEISDCNEIQYLFVIKGLDMLQTYSGLLAYLRQLQLHNLGELRNIVAPKHQGITLSFKMLKELIVCGCNKMRYVLPIHVIQNLQQLEYIKIRECYMLEGVFGDEKFTQMRRYYSTVHQISKVKSLILEKLPEFRGCCHQDGGNIEWLSLKRVRVIECAKIQKSSLGKIGRPGSHHIINVDASEGNTWANNEDRGRNIQYLFELPETKNTSKEDRKSRVGVLEIKDSKELEKYMEIGLWTSLLKKVRILEARQCNQELTKFLSYLRVLSHGLQQLTIENCEQLEQVFDLQNLASNKHRPPIFFPNLQAMRLCGLPKLSCITTYGPIFKEITTEFGNLVDLEIIECGLLKGPIRTLNFKMLKHLTVCRCNQLRYILPLHVFDNLRQLEKIVIRECEMLESVFGDDDDDKDIQVRESTYTVHQLPQVKILILLKLPKFIGCCKDGCMVEWLSLKTFKVAECPMIQKSSLGIIKTTLLTSENMDKHNIAKFFEVMDELSRADELKIKGSEHLKKYMEMKLLPSSFNNLETLEIRQCDQEIDHFLPTFFQGSSGLKNIIVENCELLEQVFNLGDSVPNIPNLKRIRLHGLPKLNCIWNIDPKIGGTIKIGNQVVLEITKCHVLKGPLPTFLLEKLIQLKIESCDMIEYVIAEEKEIMHHRILHNLEDLQLVSLQNLTKFSSSHCNLTFPNLRTLRIENCSQLKVITTRISSNQTTNEGTANHAPQDEQMALLFIPALSYGKVPLQNLETMKILDCNEIQYLFAIEGHDDMLETYSGLLPNLRQLHLSNLDQFTSIVPPKHPGRTLSFKMLNELMVCGCNKMRYVLPLHVIQSLQQLEIIDIRDCNMLERVFGDEEVTQMKKSNTNSTVHKFSQVKSLILEKLPKFTGWCQHDGCKSNVEWLSLTSVRVVDCPIIQESSLGKIDRPLLTSVEVNDYNTWAMPGIEYRENNIKYLFKLTDEISNKEILEIEGSDELKKYMEMKLQPPSFSRLKILWAKNVNAQLNYLLSTLLHLSNGVEKLTVENCKMLEQVFDLTEFVAEDIKGNLKFPNLNTIQLLCLPNLKWLWNKDPRGILGLSNLVKLEIVDCGLHRTPLSITLLEKLDALKALKIESCEMIEQVVEDDMEMQERILQKLEGLQLVNLPKLTKFNSGNCNFRFPNLLSLTIEKCPQKAFTVGFLCSQTLPMEGDTDHVANENMDACSTLQTLKLVGHEAFKEIWQCWVSNKIDCELKEVEVDSFSNLKYIFPSTMLPILLKKLEKLVLRNCISLTNVFQPMRKNDSNMAFESLKIIRVKGCDSLQRLLLPSTYPGLREIDISDCQNLVEIFIDLEIKVDKKCFPDLESIVLENLPVLSSLSPLRLLNFQNSNMRQ